jgi:hypothetical protein
LVVFAQAFEQFAKQDPSDDTFLKARVDGLKGLKGRGEPSRSLEPQGVVKGLHH